MPFERTNMASCVFDDKIYIIGGQASDGNTVCADVVSYDLIKNSWLYLTPLPTPLQALTACTANGKIYAIGGAKNGETNSVFEYNHVIDR